MTSDHASKCGPSLLAGVARVEITPPLGQPMGGFLERFKNGKGGCESIHDPLHARVLLLRSPRTSIALVSVDLLLFSSEYVVRQAKQRWNIDHVILSCTHTHAGPIPCTGGMPQWADLDAVPTDIMDFAAFRADPWFAQTEEKVIAAIGEAAGNTFAARLGVGQADAGEYLAHNRRLVNPDGTVTMLWANPRRIPTAPIDNTVGVLRVDDESGRPRVLAAHYACHPVTLGGSVLEISADFPGYLVNEIEALNPGCMAMFLQGAQGDIDVILTGSSGQAGHDAARHTGVTLGRKAHEIASSIRTQPPGDQPLFAQAATLRVAHRRDAGRVFDLGMTTLLLDRRMAMVSVNGEPFVQHQIDLAAQSPVPGTWMLGLAYNGTGVPWGMYLPTVKAHREGGYGASSALYLQADTAQRIVQQAITTLQQEVR